MRRSRFSVEQIVAVLKHVELGMVMANACRKMGISERRSGQALEGISERWCPTRARYFLFFY